MSNLDNTTQAPAASVVADDLGALETHIRYLAGLHPEGDRVEYSTDKQIRDAERGLVSLYDEDPEVTDWIVAEHAATLLLGRRDDSPEWHAIVAAVEIARNDLAELRYRQRRRNAVPA